MANSYTPGQNVTFTVEFRLPIVLTLVDPTTVTFRIRTPETGGETVYVFPATITKTAVGMYTVDYLLDYPGDWYARWEGTGAFIGAKEWRIFIKESMF